MRIDEKSSRSILTIAVDYRAFIRAVITIMKLSLLFTYILGCIENYCVTVLDKQDNVVTRSSHAEH